MAEFGNTMELRFATHDEIVAELKRRYAAVLLVVERSGVANGDVENITDFGGGKVYALGLAKLAECRLMRMMGDVVEVKPEPDADGE